MNKLSILSLALFSVSGFSAHIKTTCVSGQDERVIEVVHTGNEPSPCEVRYTKAGETKTVWTSQHSGSYCEEKAQGLAEKLAAAAFKCDNTTVDKTDNVQTAQPIQGPSPAPKQ
jgi:hypothetical protein